MNDFVVQEELEFKINDLVVCPIHGLGRISAIVEEDIFNTVLKVYIINIKAGDIILRIPVKKICDCGIRHINNPDMVDKILDYLSKPHDENNKIMWNKRHILYEENVNSTDLFKIMFVIKDLYWKRNKTDEQNMTFSEKSIYKIAIDKVSNEISCILNISQEDSEKIIFDALKKS